MTQAVALVKERMLQHMRVNTVEEDVDATLGCTAWLMTVMPIAVVVSSRVPVLEKPAAMA